ncbi:MAG: rhodanese-like domain-containing protein [Pseudomonadota bacterium]
MPRSIMDKVREARAAVPDISAEDARALHGRANVVFVDVRDGEEAALSGRVAGAVQASRGMLEFKADPALPSRHPDLSPEKTVIVYCASGGRSALAGVALQELGYEDVRNLGGFKDWAEAGGPIER